MGLCHAGGFGTPMPSWLHFEDYVERLWNVKYACDVTLFLNYLLQFMWWLSSDVIPSPSFESL